MENVPETTIVVAPVTEADWRGPLSAAHRFLGWLFMTDAYIDSLTPQQVAAKAGVPWRARPAWLARAETEAQAFFDELEAKLDIEMIVALTELAAARTEFARVFMRRPMATVDRSVSP